MASDWTWQQQPLVMTAPSSLACLPLVPGTPSYGSPTSDSLFGIWGPLPPLTHRKKRAWGFEQNFIRSYRTQDAGHQKG